MNTNTKSFFFALFLAFPFFSGCSIFENPDEENFEVEYEEPSFEEQERQLINGEKSNEE